ncbi:type II toxin-antitoxin system RelE/ParE family toxin [Candidatus Woesearchaeota archaeon]|nr:type II toxin-antitoxin system RelE/ParE family toxin [Candidatus Woesearchaeota archaeon]
MYDIVFTNKAEREFKKLEKNIQERIVSSLERCRLRPESHFERLVGDKGFKLRVGDYRVIADIIHDKIIILILKVGHRKNIYDKF